MTDYAHGHRTTGGIYAYPWTSGTGFGARYALASGISGTIVRCRFSGDNAAIAGAIQNVTRGVDAYPWTEGTGFGTKFTAPSTSPNAYCRALAFNGSSDIALAKKTTPFIIAYPWSSSGFGTKYSDPGTTPTGGEPYAVDFNGSQDIALGNNGSPYVNIYPWTSGTGFGTRYSNAASAPTARCNGIDFCRGATTDICVSVYNWSSNNLWCYPWTSGTGFGTKYSNPATWPQGYANNCMFIGTGDLIVGNDSSPRITAYPWTVGTGFGTKYANPATLPAGAVGDVAVNGTSDVAGGHFTSPYVTAYPWTSGTGFGTKYADPSTLPVDAGYGAAFSNAVAAKSPPISKRPTRYWTTRS